MAKIILIISSVSGALGVALGAFGAHKFQDFLIETNRYDTFQTGVKYHFFHTIMAFLIGMLLIKYQHTSLGYAGIAFLVGVLLFSGSIYIICFSGITKFGMITPFGGLLFIVGWLLCAHWAYKTL